MSTNLEEIATFIASTDSETAEMIRSLATDRIKTMHNVHASLNASLVKAGDTVELHDLRPQYLNGVRAKVVRKRGPKSFEVEFNQGVGKYRAGVPIGVPAACITKVEEGS